MLFCCVVGEGGGTGISGVAWDAKRVLCLVACVRIGLLFRAAVGFAMGRGGRCETRLATAWDVRVNMLVLG